MSKVQKSPLAPPSTIDVDKQLPDYTSKIQESFSDLFQDAHVHNIRTSDPAPEDGEVGDILPVDDGTDKYLVIKYADGWFKTTNLTAI